MFFAFDSSMQNSQSSIQDAESQVRFVRQSSGHKYIWWNAHKFLQARGGDQTVGSKKGSWVSAFVELSKTSDSNALN